MNIHHHSRLDSGESLIPLLEYFSLNKSASLGGNGTVNNALNNPRNIDVLILGDITYVTKYSDDKRANFERLMREARNVGIAVIASISREMVSENDLNNLTHTIPNTILGGVDDVEL